MSLGTNTRFYLAPRAQELLRVTWNEVARMDDLNLLLHRKALLEQRSEATRAKRWHEFDQLQSAIAALNSYLAEKWCDQVEEAL